MNQDEMNQHIHDLLLNAIALYIQGDPENVPYLLTQIKIHLINCDVSEEDAIAALNDRYDVVHTIRIPEFTDTVTWTLDMMERGLCYHIDDDPRDVINKDKTRVFTNEECVVLDNIINSSAFDYDTFFETFNGITDAVALMKDERIKQLILKSVQ